MEEKAKVVTRLIIDNCDTGLFVAASLKDTKPDIRLGEKETRQALAETAALLLSMVDRPAFKFLGSTNRDVFMDAVEAGVAGAMQDKGVEPRSFQELLGKRYEEYAQYQKWVPEAGEPAKGTLVWVFGKKIADMLCVGPNALFQSGLTILLLKAFVRWKLHELLPE